MYRTGSTALDILLDGGYRPGHIYLLQGPDGSGKTLLGLTGTIRLQPYFTPFILALEPLDLRWPQQLGLNLAETLYTTCPYVENLAQALFTIQQPLVIYADSLSYLLSVDEDTSLLHGMEGVSYANRYFLESVLYHCNTYGSIGLVTAQLRGGNWTERTTADAVLTQYVHYRIQLYRDVSGIRVDILQDPYQPPGQWATTPISSSGIDQEMELLALSETFGIVQRRGSWYYFGEIRLGQGRTEAATALYPHKAQIDALLLGGSG